MSYKKLLVVTLLLVIFQGVAHAEKLHIKKILSGDTLLLDDGRSVQLIGVDSKMVKARYAQLGPAKAGAPHKVYNSGESFIADTAGEASIDIELDEAFAKNNHMDSNGNLLGYVYINVPEEIWSAFDHTATIPQVIAGYEFMDDQFIYDKKTHRIFLNASLVWSGNGDVDKTQPFKYAEKFIQYEEEAKLKGKGQWQ